MSLSKNQTDLRNEVGKPSFFKHTSGQDCEDGELPFIRHKTKGETEFILRRNRREAIHDRCIKQSRFAGLTQGSILVGLDRAKNIVPLTSHSNWRTVFHSSLITAGVGRKILSSYHAIEKQYYNMTEQAYQNFTAGIMLAIRDIDTDQILTEFWNLKRWCFRVGCNPAGARLVSRYMKYLTKVSQCLFLNVPVPQAEEGFPTVSVYDTVDELKFIGKMKSRGYRTEILNRKGAYMLAQIAQFGRAGPYADKHMVEEMLEKTIQLVTTKKTIASSALVDHRKGLLKIFERLHEPTDSVLHVSMSGSGSTENSNSQGGKGAYMADLARKIANRVIADAKSLSSVVGLVDCFGQELISIEVAHSCVRRLVGGFPTLWGDVIYTPLLEFTKRKFDGEQVPFGLAKILLLAASEDIKSHGRYNQTEVSNDLKVPLFKSNLSVVFMPTVDSITVNAAVSIEAAGKSRLVTSNPAAYTQLGQTINHYCRSWLSKDPFCRVGFEEGDKLWELLKSYGKYYSSGFFQTDKEHGTTPDFGVHKN